MFPPILDRAAALSPSELVWVYIGADAVTMVTSFVIALLLSWNVWRYGIWAPAERWLAVTLCLIWLIWWRGSQNAVRILGHFYDIYEIEIVVKVIAATSSLVLALLLVWIQEEVRRVAREPGTKAWVEWFVRRGRDG